MKLHLPCTVPLALCLGWFGVDRFAVEPAAAAAVACEVVCEIDCEATDCASPEDCRIVDCEDLGDGTCLVTCENDAGERCEEVVACEPSDCSAVDRLRSAGAVATVAEVTEVTEGSEACSKAATRCASPGDSGRVAGACAR